MNISVYRLSEISEVSKITITNFEKGGNITISTYLKILNALENEQH